MSILVTGGAGFIGSALVRALVADGERVVTLDKLTYAGSLENLRAVAGRPNHRFEAGDICDGELVRRLLAEERPRVIFHLAAESHVDRSIDRPMSFIETNVSGTAILLEAAHAYWRELDGVARGAFRFLMVSTDEVYGELGAEGLFREDDPYRPNSPYSASKAAADHLARAWGRTYGLPVLVTNCSNNYGPHQFPEKLIPLMVLNALDGKPLPVYGQGLQVRDWLHVDDHVAALRLVAAKGRVGETYLVGARNEWRNIDLVRRLCAELDRLHPAGAPHERLITFVADRPGHDARYAIDPGKIERELGFRPGVPFDDGLARTIAWYMTHRDWCEAVRPGAGRERLGLARAMP
ncbi:MAG: dTDP-glucose 4,6-dehydratase [Alphaproteobacteria bacterium]|nr:dTDP-glucose 4,6-dehydratase [Alphaproteobacteria bacterium]